MRIFDPVGIVHAVDAAFDEVGCVTRSVLGKSRGSAELLVARVTVEFDGAADVVVVVVVGMVGVVAGRGDGAAAVVLSSPN